MPSYSWTLTVPPAEPSADLSSVVFSSEAARVDPDWGFDILTLPNLDTSFTPRRDSVALADAFVRRLFTPRGVIWSDPTYGFDIRDYLNDEVSQSMLAEMVGGIQAQSELDERIHDCQVRAAYNFKTEKLSLRIGISSDLGPFNLVLAIGDLSTDILLEL